MELNKELRIVNKSKEGCTIKVNGMTTTIPWKEFDELYIMSDDKRTCRLNDKAMEKFQRMDEILNGMVADYLLSLKASDSTLKMSGLLGLGDNFNKLQDEFGLTSDEIISLVQQRIGAFNSLYSQTPRRESRKERQRRFEENEKKRKEQRLDNVNNHIQTVGSGNSLADNDVLANLKAKMENN